MGTVYYLLYKENISNNSVNKIPDQLVHLFGGFFEDASYYS